MQLEELDPLRQRLLLLQEYKRRQDGRKLFKYYPDEGPLCRKLYPKHTAFFAAGKDNRERLMIAANRVGKCCTINTLIDTPKGKRSIKELLPLKEFEVWAYDEESKRQVVAKAHSPFKKKGLHHCYRITMADGSWVECADHHRILTDDGWKLLSQLLPQYDVDHHLSNLGRARKVRVSNGQHLIETPVDYQDDYFADHHQYGEQLPSDLENDPTFLPLQDGAQKHNPAWFGLGVLANKGRCNLLRFFARLSSKNVVLRSVDQFAGFLNRLCSNIVGRSLDLFQAPSPFLLVSVPESQSYAELDQSVRCTSTQPYSSPVTLASNKIVSVEYIGRNEVYDFTVEKYHNYIAADLVHHNTEGVGGYEVAVHATGLYPEWWDGYRFDRPPKIWVSGDTSKTVRDILQFKLLGPFSEPGTGLIPADTIERRTLKPGVPDAIEDVFIKHTSGGQSRISFKSYDQGRDTFQGTEQDIIWMDEEPPLAIYTECLLRTMTTNGLIICTFTPLEGLSETVMHFMPSGNIEDATKFMITATWDDVPHLTTAQKEELWESIPAYQRDARSKGIPQLGSGAIYPVPESQIVVEPFDIPKYWPRAYGMDVGWNRTAVIWGALDRDSDTLYLYSEHYQGKAEPPIHAAAVKARGDYIPGTIDPASRGRGQLDGSQLLQNYIELGLELTKADNAVEAGIQDVWTRLSTGRLKVFNSCRNWINEFRLYRRDDKGNVVKTDDHLMDATRYLVRTGLDLAISPARLEQLAHDDVHLDNTRNEVTGY